MDRQFAYTGAIPQTGDILKAEKATMVALGYLGAAFLGNCATPQVDGLACTPTTPASLQVNVGVGSLYSAQTVDASAYGDLGTDTTRTIVKQGLLQDPVTLTITPPGTVGYSQVYLVQAIFAEVDGGSVVLPYYNAANPSVPFNGPANAGTSNFTVRQGKITVQLKAGTAATTGTQTTPAPDAGYVGLYAITVANGATTITSGNIVTLKTAPFIPTKLPTVPADVQSGKWMWATVGGTANALTLTVNPAPTAYTTGQSFRGVATATNTGASTVAILDANGTSLGTVALRRRNGAALSQGDIVAGQVFHITNDGTAFQLVTQLENFFITQAFAGGGGAAGFSGTFVVPTGVTRIFIRAWGAGGGGGGSVVNSAGGGGGGGGYAENWFPVLPGVTLTIQAGTGGSAGGVGSAGGNGTASFVTAPSGPVTGTLLSAGGGQGGGGGATGIGGVGAAGGTSAGGSFQPAGSPSQSGQQIGSNWLGGVGGPAPLAGGIGYPAAAGQVFGCGGGGGRDNATAPGAGAGGLVTISW